MTHRKDLIKQGYKSKGYGTKKDMQDKGQHLVVLKRAKYYRVVPYGRRWELYAK